MEQSRPLRRMTLFGIAAIALLTLGVLIGRSLAPTHEDGADNAHRSPNSRGTGTGLRSESGALEAATDFAEVLSGAIEEPDSYHDVVLGFAAPEWEAEAEILVTNTLGFVNRRYGEGAEISFTPIRYRIAEFSDVHAVVALWGVTVASGSKIAGLEESWTTGTIRLRWITNRWLVVDQASQAGPTPELLGSSDEIDASVLQGFREYEHAVEF